MGMQELGPTHITSEKTRIFPSSENQEDTWIQNETSEIRENQKRDYSLNIF